MDHPEGLGSASASEVPPVPLDRGITSDRDRVARPLPRTGAWDLWNSTLDLPAITPPISPTPSGAGIPPHEINSEIIFHDLTTESSPPFSRLMPDTVAAGMNLPHSTLDAHNSTITSSLPFSTPLRERIECTRMALYKSFHLCHLPFHFAS